MTVSSFTDIAIHVRKQYAKRKKKSSKDRNLFVTIQKEAFNLWGKDFGYDDIHKFKSDLSILINKIRKESINSSEEVEITNGLNNKNKPLLEGRSCFSFTFKQIVFLGLNPDSYL